MNRSCWNTFVIDFFHFVNDSVNYDSHFDGLLLMFVDGEIIHIFYFFDSHLVKCE